MPAIDREAVGRLISAARVVAGALDAQATARDAQLASFLRVAADAAAHAAIYLVTTDDLATAVMRASATAAEGRPAAPGREPRQA